ncbi:MAG: ABC transporter ATP-binding protein [Candidatus Omnitrophica bacterium]|nr:ABC transporter ATP-binding protein [Candidatus Omnitrophota bacterium]
MNEYLRMLYLARRNWQYLVGGILAMIGCAGFEGAQFGAIVPLADRIFTNKPIVLPTGLPPFLVRYAEQLNNMDRTSLFWSVVFIIPAFYLVKGGLVYLRGLFMNTLAQRSVTDVRGDLFRKYQDLSLDFYSQKRQGELMSRITNDAGFIGHAISFGLTDIFYQSILAVMFAVIALTISWKMVLIILVVFPANAWFIHVIGKTIKKQSIQSQESMADLNSILAETNQGVSIVKAFSREKHEIERFDVLNKKFYRAIIKGIRRSLVLSPITEFLAALAIMVVFLIGGQAVLAGKMSFGVFALFISSLISIQRPIKKLAEVYSINQQALASSKRVYDFLDWKTLITDAPGAKECAAPGNAIRFADVSFRYDKDQAGLVIKNFTHNFEIGKMTALVGPTGCGKTTIMNLILRFYDVDSGVVSFDGQNIREVTVSSLRSHVGLVTQDMILFNESIRENLRYGKLDATDEEVLEAARQAMALEFIERMPEGLDTIVGDRGMKLSGGQKQRLCIARAILKDPRILLLDEATSALDPQSEHMVQQALDNLMKDRTVIVIAHRLSTIRHADCILVMENGRIMQKGIHDDLLNTSELYARLASYHFNQ